ncbi:MAG: S9 family peptidase [Jiangellaceae bacterium]
MSNVTPYGSWDSPIDARLVARNEGRPGWVSLPGGVPWWVEPRPSEGGRVALLRRAAGADQPEVVLPAPWNVRTRVHEYGGQAYLVHPGEHGPTVVFAEFSDQRLYAFDPDVGGDPRPLTPVPERAAGLRYVEPITVPGGAEVWCIREEHTGPAPTDVSRAIVAVPLDGTAADHPSAVRVLVADRHFLACLRISPDGRRLSWIGWDHPHMPWDCTELRVAPIAADGTVGAPVTVAGGQEEAVCQAEWESPDALLLVTDPTGWWNLHRVALGPDGRAVGAAVNLCPREEEFGSALWQPGMRWFAPLGGTRVAVVHGRAATSLGVLDTATGELVDIDTGHTEWAATLAAHGGLVGGVAGGPQQPIQVLQVDPAADNVVAVTDDAAAVDAAFLPTPVARTFTGRGGREVYADIYPPRHPEHIGPPDQAAPFVVFVHGGPTSRVPMVYDLEVAYFTSRGIGVVEVNYGGSTGHGREYRNRLRQNWGIVDVEDSVAVAEALVVEGLADHKRLAIRGGSAGGYTSAAVLTFTDAFACGVIHYPVLDLVTFRSGGTHDFESQYLDGLVGPWPQTEQRYRDRSPINYADQLRVPFVLMQGLEDQVCPPAQAEAFITQIAGSGVPHAYLTFAGEQHGFRREDTIATAMEAELSLYAQVFGFEPAGELPVVELRA